MQRSIQKVLDGLSKNDVRRDTWTQWSQFIDEGRCFLALSLVMDRSDDDDFEEQVQAVVAAIAEVNTPVARHYNGRNVLMICKKMGEAWIKLDGSVQLVQVDELEDIQVDTSHDGIFA